MKSIHQLHEEIKCEVKTIQSHERALFERDTIKSTLEEVLQFFLERKDPLLKAKRREQQEQNKNHETEVISETEPAKVRTEDIEPEEGNKTSLKAKAGTKTPRLMPALAAQSLRRKNSTFLRNVRERLPARLQQQLQLRDDGHCHRRPNGSLCSGFCVPAPSTSVSATSSTQSRAHPPRSGRPTPSK